MEVFLYNSTVCRLCGEENDSGTFLYSYEENNQNLSEVINTFLPIKVSDDGQLPRTICPGCTIQLEATVEFLNLIISGQKVIRELHLREKEYKKTVLKGSDAEDAVTENIVYQINTNEGVYSVEHPTALQVSGLDRPKRKRGRPPKKAKSPEEVAQEAAAKEKEIAEKKVDKQSEIPGKRRRKTPTRFREAVQGKELDRIFKEEGVTDGEESDAEAERAPPREPEVIGHMETSGELVVVVKGKGRGRPKGRMRQTREQCAICGMEFSCVGRYMSHIAQHGPVMYQCGQCALTFATRLDFKHHQVETEHSGQNVIQCSGNEATGTTVVAEDIKEPIAPVVDDPLKPSVPLSMPSLRDITKSDDDQANEDFLASSVKDQIQKVENGDANDKENTMPESGKPIGGEGSDGEGAPAGKVKLKCPQCDKLFSSKQSKSLHIKAVHEGQKPYECGECGVRFAYPRSLALHVLAHRRHRQPDRRYACDLCGKVLNHPSSVVYHKQAAHAGQRYVCGKCGKPFRHRQLLRRHQLVHEQARPFQCKTCNASFKTKANLLNHQLLHSGVKKFSCEICKHKFAHKTSLTLHMRWHTGTKPYTCQVCGKSFSQKGNLSEHERIHTGEKPYACTLCPRRFTTSSQWRLHARRHQPDRPYPCHHCPKRFVSRGSWALHQMRAGLVPAPAAASHPCVECGRAFASRRALGRHARLHAGPRRPARCDVCPRSFADVYSLNRHKRQVHKQVSLLATDLQPIAQVVEMETVEQMEGMEIEAKTEVETEAEVALEADAEEALDSDERVIYVAYDVDDSESAFHILDADEAASLPGGAHRAFPALAEQLERLASPAEPIESMESIEAMDPLESQDDHMPVTDEQGNPLTLTMADGSRLAVTSADGRSLQVVTSDGTAIPVSIDAFQDDDEELEESTETATIVHELDMDKVEHCGPGEPVTHYFTIV